MILAISFLILGLIIISLTVFGGGQVFMPIFKWFWEILNDSFGIRITEAQIDSIFTISNVTPGVLSTKFSLFSGILFSNNLDGQAQWWGFLLMFLTYSVFCLPAIFIMYFSAKYLKKFEDKKYIKSLLLLMKPIVAGIIISISIQLFINCLLPFINFNGSKGYLVINHNSTKSSFFTGWRLYVIFAYVPIMFLLGMYLYNKKISLFWIILIGVVSSIIVFMPWLK
ncbi:chromate transporter [Mycoplasmopsis pullorum]|uniref:chromate transporter n=1 Tax=Mycoplasmopsis pullorum TaxID=48003 RepID=UPI00111B799C|nr:chromate transporter [Mycoplasmopsis pullorum]TNK82597.1 chromate transporter [Mycoplasmopsis pullorum]TNK83496.1 chromate transporter [Mycoplasmopsis pullorum]TNK84707.1 chromate transporter [Mycoplasmopsis pullorum]TNK85738.1 chromate transporter [Mycoplasmopsis pullorum]TNK86279.1 chromate transporter [Mycoplasmopsis pullorum]